MISYQIIPVLKYFINHFYFTLFYNSISVITFKYEKPDCTFIYSLALSFLGLVINLLIAMLTRIRLKSIFIF